MRKLIIIALFVASFANAQQIKDLKVVDHYGEESKTKIQPNISYDAILDAQRLLVNMQGKDGKDLLVNINLNSNPLIKEEILRSDLKPSELQSIINRLIGANPDLLEQRPSIHGSGGGSSGGGGWLTKESK